MNNNINGVLLLNKPLGMSSNAALQKTKRLIGAKKAGHTGSLDPLATGMLPICFGEATKFSQYLINSDKRYTTVAKLGIKTKTSDAEGAVIAQKPVPYLTTNEIELILENFRGKIKQIPSMYSALKHNGKPLYEYARQGKIIERSPRNIEIYELNIVNFNNDTLTLDVHCSKGTYIRNLVEDIGDMIGCGAHVAKLHRTQVSNLPMEMVTVTQKVDKKASMRQHVDDWCENAISTNSLFPTEILVQALPSFVVSFSQAKDLLHGKIISNIGHTAGTEHPIALYTEDDMFIGVGLIDEKNNLCAKRMMNIRL